MSDTPETLNMIPTEIDMSSVEEAFPTEKKKSKISLSGILKGKIVELLLNFLVPLLCLFACGGLAIFVLIPSYKEIPSLESTLSTKKTLASQLERKVAVLRELIDFASQVEEYSNVVNKALISEAKVPELLAQVDNMMRESGMTVSSLSYSQGGIAESSGMKLVDVSLAGTGSFENLVAFLKSVENASRLVLLKDFRYNYSTQEGVKAVSATFQLQAPFLFVSSSAVTDEPIELSISSPEFLRNMEKILNLRQYDVTGALSVEPTIIQPEPVEEAEIVPALESVVVPVEEPVDSPVEILPVENPPVEENSEPPIEGE